MGKLDPLRPLGWGGGGGWSWEGLQKAGQMDLDFIWHWALSLSVTLAPFSKASLMEPLFQKREILPYGQLGSRAGRGIPCLSRGTGLSEPAGGRQRAVAVVLAG